MKTSVILTTILMIAMICLMFYYSFISFREAKTCKECLDRFCNSTTDKTLYNFNYSQVVSNIK